MASAHSNSIFTNVALTDDGCPWWEGMMGDPPAHAIDWLGKDWTPDSKDKAAHPNSRFTAPASQCPAISPEWENPKGVPISAFIFGGRRAKTAPLVFQAFDWEHGVYVGASVASEVTAAVQGQKLGVIRRDPFAIIPFCGYNMADYFAHWLSIGKKSDRVPKIFHVNWFRTDENGKFLWPGFGDNLRVLRWIKGRCEDSVEAVESPIGYVPAPGALDTEGLEGIDEQTIAELLRVDPEAWRDDLDNLREFFEKFGDRLPATIWKQYHAVIDRLGLDSEAKSA